MVTRVQVAILRTQGTRSPGAEDGQHDHLSLVEGSAAERDRIGRSATVTVVSARPKARARGIRLRAR